MIEEVFYSLLTGDSTIAAIAGARVYPVALPQDCKLPAIHFLRLSTHGTLDQKGSGGVVEAVFRFETWADDPLTSKRLANAVKANLHGLNGTIDGIQISAMRVTGEQDLFDIDPTAFRVLLDFNLFYIE